MSLQSLLTSILEGDVRSASLPNRFTPGRELPFCPLMGRLVEPNSPYVPFWRKISCSAGIRSRDPSNLNTDLAISAHFIGYSNLLNICRTTLTTRFFKYAGTDARTSYCLPCHTISDVINGINEGEEADWPLLLVDIKIRPLQSLKVKQKRIKQPVLQQQTNTYICNAMNVV